MTRYLPSANVPTAGGFKRTGIAVTRNKPHLLHDSDTHGGART